MKTFSNTQNWKRCRAFTMVELITVMAIMAILASVSIPALSMLMDNMNVAGGGAVVTSQLSLARQIAASRNCNVEVRLLQASASVGGTPYYNGIQLWAVVPPNTGPAPVSRLAMLPTGAAISSTLSPPLAVSGTIVGNMGSGTMSVGTLSSVNYISFRISPDGLINITDSSTSNLVSMAKFYFTVVTLSASTKTAVPNNYVAIQVNPATGTPLTYRP